MSARTDAAPGLSGLLTEDSPRPCEPIQHPFSEPGFRFHERGEPHEPWCLRTLMGGVHTLVHGTTSR